MPEKSQAEIQRDAEATLELRKGEASAVEEQVADAERAQTRRERGMERAGERKSYPDEAEAPPSQRGSGDEAAYSHERLIASGGDFLGQPDFVVAGALHGNEQPYLTVKEASALVKSFLDREII